MCIRDSKEDAGENPDNGELVNLVENYDYTASRGSEEADIATALTDTLRGEGNWAKLGYNAGYEPENHVVLNFDLTDMNSVSKIVMGMKRSGEDIALPKNLKIQVSYNNTCLLYTSLQCGFKQILYSFYGWRRQQHS